MSRECAFHPGVSAEWACQRCGSFVCAQCERRTRPEAPPLCPKCWDLREAAVQDTSMKESKRTAIGGLVVGIFSFLHPLVQLGSLVLNIRALMKAPAGQKPVMNIVGLLLTLAAILTWVGGIVFVATRH
ncbi:MAG: hypothetical protein ACO1OB_30170 [Archangium sp.]